MPIDLTRACAASLLLLALIVGLALCSRFAARSRRPALYWSAGGYLALLHLVSIYGLLTSGVFENGLSHLALLTFPFSMTMFDVNTMQGFVTPHDLAANYLRYIVCFGGLNALLIAAFVAFVVPPHPRVAGLPANPR